MSRFVLILVAFSILNQSIDLDYLTYAFKASPTLAAHYDDVDSITELVIEQLLDDDDYFPDNDDDTDGMPKTKGMEKFSWNPLYFQHPHKAIVADNEGIDKSSLCAWLPVVPPCKGYFHIDTPPPDRLAA